MMRPLFRLFSGGWGRLAERYATTQAPGGHIHTSQHVQIDAVRWRFCATICAMPEGLYLAVQPRMALARAVGLGKDQPPLLIPWAELRVTGPTLLYLQPAVRLAAGEPPIAAIVLMRRLYDAFGAELTSRGG
jgi:hypothetical protein